MNAGRYLTPLEPVSRHRERVSRLGEITVAGSVLALHAEAAQVDRRVVRATLKKLASFTDGELRCVARLARLSREELAELMSSVVPMRTDNDETESP